MKRLRLQRWSGSIVTPRSRPLRAHDSWTPLHSFPRCRHQTTDAVSSSAQFHADDLPVPTPLNNNQLASLPSPPVSAAQSSARLAALHARLSLPEKLPLETLARCLVDATADRSPRFNNAALAVLGSDLLSNYTSEYIIASYPRLPLPVVFAAMYAYVGPRALSTITREWGVEYAAAPGGEVDPGYLQFARVPPEPKEETFKIGPDVIAPNERSQTKVDGDGPTARFRRGMSSRSVYGDVFGGYGDGSHAPESLGKTEGKTQPATKAVTAEKASTNFVRAVMGAIYLHAGRATAKKFFQDHIRSRQLNMSALFQFRYPMRDLDKLCRREGFQSPVARILAETGRKSRHPVFVVGVFSGNDKLGEGAGASLDEARTRASVAALKGWYLYSPLEVRVPSEMEDPNAREWKPIMVDSGDLH